MSAVFCRAEYTSKRQQFSGLYDHFSRGQAVHIDICINTQQLALYLRHGEVISYSVSTAKNGTGQASGSGKTPLGRHIIRAKIGAGQPANAVFIGRRPTGEIYSPAFAEENPHRQDWILTRILWLSGLEKGINRLGNLDTMRRYIYIHGTPDSEPMGTPLSHGCIRMRNRDVVDLFERTDVGTAITIF